MASEPPKSSPKTKAAERDEAQQDGFLREVDEALREEQMVDAVKRWAKPVALGVVAVLVAMGGYTWWDRGEKAKAGDLSERAILALDKLEQGQLDAAAKDLNGLVGKGTDGNRAVVAMTLAAIALEQGKTDEAAKKFAAIAADQTMPKPFRDLATVREVSIRFDSMKPADVIAKLKPLAVPGNAFFGSAGEMTAMAYLEMGKPELAGPLFAQIAKDKNVPESLRGRARKMAGSLGYEAGDEDLPTDSPSGGATGPADASAATTKK